jgi:hypothetical protein
VPNVNLKHPALLFGLQTFLLFLFNSSFKTCGKSGKTLNFAWYKSIVEKAKKENKSVEEVLKNDAKWMYDNEKK